MTENTRRRRIRRGDQVHIKPEWQDPGDNDIAWIAVEDEDGNRVRIAPLLDLPFPGNHVVTTEMIEHGSLNQG